MIETHPVFVRSDGPSPIMDIVRDLRAKGLVQGIHFDFAYNQTQRHYADGYDLVRNGATFTFSEEKWATFFRIKYGDDIQKPTPGTLGISW